MHSFSLLVLLALLLCVILPAHAADSPRYPDPYNVVWTTSSADATGAMPLGNGEIGVNVWVEGGGRL
jgi:alpha-L-fucosidase 2